MKLLPVQRAAVGVGLIDALVVVSTVLPGAPLLPTWMVVVAIALTVGVFVLMIVTVKQGPLRVNGLKGLFRALREALPMGAIILAGVGFYGGWLIAMVTMTASDTAGNLKYENGQYTSTERKVVRVLTEEQYTAAQSANQRMFGAIAMALASGGFALTSVVRQLRQN